MKRSIAYVWIENYENVLVNIGLNFGSEQIFNVEFAGDKLVITGEANPNYISNFFESPGSLPGIVNISAILGKNGTGKSLLCKFLREIVTANGRSTDFLIIYRIEDQNKQIRFEADNISDYELEDKTSLLAETRNKIKRYNYEGIEFGRDWIGVPNSNVIYYSSLIDYSNIELLNRIPAGIDISSNYLSYKDIENDENSRGRLSANDFLILPRVANFKRQYRMLKEFRSFIFPSGGIQIHFSDINIRIVRLDNDLSKIWDSDNGWNVPDDFKTIVKEISDKYKSEDKELKLKRTAISREPENEKLLLEIDQAIYVNNFGFNALTFFIYNINYDNTHLNHSAKIDIYEIRQKSFMDSVKHFFNHQGLIDATSLILSIELIQNKKNEIEFIGDPLRNTQIKLDEETIFALFVNNLKATNDFQNVYTKGITRVFNEFLEFDWGTNLSSGEKFYLDLFSRLYYAKTIINNADDEPIETRRNKLILILLDEAEIGFHPEWQKEYVNNIVKTIPWIFAQTGTQENGLTPLVAPNIQIILTSHSPFPLSDIPISNAIFFDKKEREDGAFIRTSYYGKEVGLNDTFAANIHELYSESFFMGNGLIGEFAQDKIKDLIKYLKFDSKQPESDQNPKPKENWTEDSAQPIINIIGEPLIKERLQFLYDKKVTHEDERAIEARIQQLQNKLNTLKRSNEDNTN